MTADPRGTARARRVAQRAAVRQPEAMAGGIRAMPVAAAGSDLPERFRLLQHVHDAVLSGSGAPPVRPRPVISESWRRSLAAAVDPDDYRPPVVYSRDQIGDVRGCHPLHAVVPLLRGMLVDIADECQHIMIVTDADGTILWREGDAGVRVHADPVGLCEGTRWTEEAIGTNAMGTALAVDAPVQIESAEHLVRTYHTWTCAAAPIHDPDTGCLLGAVDVSGYLRELHPAVVNLVTASAQLAEGQLRMRLAARDERLLSRNIRHLSSLRGEPGALLAPSGRLLAGQPRGAWPERLTIRPGQDRIVLSDGREAVVEPLPEGYLVRARRGTPATARPQALSLSFLRRDRPGAVLDGRELPLTLRHAELLTLLALHPDGLTAEQLALQLYGDHGNPTTVRAEIHRLRTQLGERCLQTRPYRLRADVDADFIAAQAALRGGDVGCALAVCHAPLLARSDAPAIRAERDQLTATLRRAVLDDGDLDALWAYGQREPGNDDLEVFERLARELPAGDPRRPIAQARQQWLQLEGW